MAETEPGDEYRVSKRVVYEQSTGTSSRSTALTILFVAIVAIAIIVFIVLQMT